MTTFPTDTLIIGAGMSGLMAARTLTEAGKRVLVVDKARSIGGRMGTRRLGAGQADHGAQYFTAGEPEFRAYTDQWLADNLIFEWSRGWSDGSLVDTRDGQARYAVRGGMGVLMQMLAEGIEVRTNTEIVAVNRLAEGWQATDSDGGHTSAHTLILSAPVPQSLTLLAAGAVALDHDDETALRKIDYEPCITALLLIDGEASLPAPGAIQRTGAHITWIADNKRKGMSPQTLLTVQAGTSYSRALWERNDEDILASIRIDMMPFIGENTPFVQAEVKRWRYSIPISLYPERCLTAKNLPLVFAGDAFGEPRVEGAFMSGLAAGRAAIHLLG